MENKKKPILLNLTPDQHKLIKQAASHSGLDVTNFIRSVAIQQARNVGPRLRDSEGAR